VRIFTDRIQSRAQAVQTFLGGSRVDNDVVQIGQTYFSQVVLKHNAHQSAKWRWISGKTERHAGELE